MAKYKIGITEAGDAGLDLSWKERLESVTGSLDTRVSCDTFYMVRGTNATNHTRL